MGELFNRDFAITVGTTRIATRPTTGEDTSRPTLRVSFKVEKTSDGKPNKAQVSIWNLSDDTRSKLQEKNLPTIITAGYVGNTEIIFRGDLTNASHTREGADWVSKISSGDGSRAYRTSRISESMRPPALVKDVLKKIVGKLGVGTEQALKKINEGNFRGGLEQFAKGVSLDGAVSSVLDTYAKAAGFDWSIQDGQLILLKENETTENEVVSLSPETGLIGSPEVGEKSIVKARSLLQGKIRPGGRLQIVSKELNGFFRVLRVIHNGDTWASPWYTDLEARALK